MSRWTFAGIIECMRQWCRHTVSVDGIEFQQDGELTKEQLEIMELLQIT